MDVYVVMYYLDDDELAIIDSVWSVKSEAIERTKELEDLYPETVEDEEMGAFVQVLTFRLK